MNNRILANAIRILSLDAVNAANSGHPGAPMGMADIATILGESFSNIIQKSTGLTEIDSFYLMDMDQCFYIHCCI